VKARCCVVAAINVCGGESLQPAQ